MSFNPKSQRMSIKVIPISSIKAVIHWQFQFWSLVSGDPQGLDIISPNTADVHGQIYVCKDKSTENLPMCAWTLLSRPKYKVLIKISQGGRPLTGTKGFTVINQIYLQFIQMLNQQKYKKKITRCKIKKQVRWRHHCSTEDSTWSKLQGTEK